MLAAMIGIDCHRRSLRRTALQAGSSLFSVLLGTLLSTLSVQAQTESSWRAAELVDPRSDQAAAGVVGTGATGFRLELARQVDGSVLGFFRLGSEELDILDEELPLRLQFDDEPPVGLPTLGGGLQWLAFPVWNGEGDALTGTLRDLMTRTRLTIQYSLSGGGYKQAEFGLGGSAEVLAEAFGVRSEVPEAELREARAMEELVAREAIKCSELKKKKQKTCIEAARSCLASSTDADSLGQCLASGGG